MKKVKLSLEELEKNSDAIATLLNKRGLLQVKGGANQDANPNYCEMPLPPPIYLDWPPIPTYCESCHNNGQISGGGLL
ncbi:MAG: hypothetical protein LBC17_01790 [Lactobacillaceae bacterium]|jgi:hypothetical protein|nr:hypothetical protein [Lactobacillaceae bacterium]